MKTLCKNFGVTCRSCDLMHLGIQKALEHKYNSFIEIVKRYYPEVVPKPLFEPAQIFPSRAKVKVSVTGTASDPVIGLLDAHLEASELLDCPLHLPKLNEILTWIKGKVIAEKLHPYQPKRRLGELKGIILMGNEDASQIIVRFVLRSLDLKKRMEKVSGELQRSFPEVKVVSINLQPVHHALLEGKEEMILTSEHSIWAELNGVKIAYGPQSFMQVTPQTAAALYGEAAMLLKASGVKDVVEFFCGTGGFLLTAAKQGTRGVGYEQSFDAVSAATEGVKRNGAVRVDFFEADLAAAMPEVGKHVDAVIVNPPRRGIGEKVREYLVQRAPGFVLYSSCNPESMCEDMKGLPQYKLNYLKPFDMFPMTEHVEALALFEKLP